MKYLGIDYGLRKIGLATSEGELAAPLKVISVQTLPEAVNFISTILQQEEIDVVVVGKPDRGLSAKSVEKFIMHLGKKITERKMNIKIIKADETLSSKQAKKIMIEFGISKKNREDEDAYSAALILQNFLDSEKNL